MTAICAFLVCHTGSCWTLSDLQWHSWTWPATLALSRLELVGSATNLPEQEIMQEQERWLSVEEIAVHLGVNRDTIYKWIDRRQMPAHKLGKLWKFKASEVDEWIRAGKAGEGANR